MKYFAKLDNTHTVITVNCVSDNDAPTEEVGVAFLSKLYNYAYWKQTYKDGTRKNFGNIGCQYSTSRDAFIPKQPYPSWVLNDETCNWDAPVAEPDDGEKHVWNETSKTWEAFNSDGLN